MLSDRYFTSLFKIVIPEYKGWVVGHYPEWDTYNYFHTVHDVNIRHAGACTHEKTLETVCFLCYTPIPKDVRDYLDAARKLVYGK